jgi:adenylate kinase
MGRLIVLMGPTGAGKSAQGDLLAASLNGVHLSSGELLRRDPVTAAIISDGRLAGAGEVHRVLSEAMRQVAEDQPIVMDGTPRTMSDVHWIDEAMPGMRRKLERVVMIDIDFDTALKRLAAGVRGRADDAPQALKAKWELYEDITKPVANHYREQGLVAEVDGRGSIEEVHKAIMAALNGAAKT